MTKFVPKVLVMVSVSSDLVEWFILASCDILYIFSQSRCFDTVLSLSIFDVKTGIFDCGLRFKSICIWKHYFLPKRHVMLNVHLCFLLLKASTVWDFRLGFIYFRRNTNSQTRAPQSFLFPSPADDLIRKAPILNVSSLQTPPKSLR